MREGWFHGREILRHGETFGRYVVLHRVGSGGMGIVYAAYDTVLDRRIAVKILPSRLADEAAKQRLLREAQAMARLSHPHVATVFDAGRRREGRAAVLEARQGLSEVGDRAADDLAATDDWLSAH